MEPFLSHAFSEYEGVRQGAVLFCIVYMLITVMCCLKRANINCLIRSSHLGALCYADNPTFIAPTSYTMRLMLNICDKYASVQAALHLN
jgi:hypothetical protein